MSIKCRGGVGLKVTPQPISTQCSVTAETEWILAAQSPCSCRPMRTWITGDEWHHPLSHSSSNYHTFKSTSSVFRLLQETTSWIFSSAAVSLKMEGDKPLPSKSPQSAITSKLNIPSCYYHNRFLPPGGVSIHNLIFYALPLSRCCQRSWRGGAECEEGGA